MKTRRDFLFSGLSGLLLTSVSHFFKNTAQAQELIVPSDAKESIIKQSHIAMGTFVSFTAFHYSRQEAFDAFALAIQEIARLEKIFSRHDRTSALAVLNSEGKLQDAPSELVYVLKNSIKIAKESQNIYNPAIKPLLDIFEANQNPLESAHTIDTQLIKEAQELTQVSAIQVKEHAINFQKQGMGITLDSLAKGYIIDKASDLLLTLNIKNHIINAGGDIIAKGVKNSKNEVWIVGIENPQNPHEIITKLPLKNQAIATSGSYQKFFDKDIQRHHIINPKTAASPQISSVTCKASSAMFADAYATFSSLVSDKASARKVLTENQIIRI